MSRSQRPAAGSSRVGESFEVEVGPVAHGGHCVARYAGQVVFVRHALPGELVRAEVTEGREGDRFLRADAVEVLRAAPQRVPRPCPWAGPGKCGGCDWQHASLEQQRELKAAVVREQLQRLAGVDLPVVVEPVPGDVDGLRWRTRVEFAVDGSGRAGLRRHRSHDIVAIDDCPIATEAVARSGVLQTRWPQATSVDVVDPSVGEVVMVPVPHGQQDVPVVGEQVRAGDWSRTLRVGARGFWQVHPGAASTFVAEVLAGLAPQAGERAVDLYCGVGLFAAALADVLGPEGDVLAVESDRDAVRQARRNLSAAGARVEVRAGRVDRALRPLVRQGINADLVVLDPPRSGAGRSVVADVIALAPRRIAYVACDPAALARDLAYASAGGYGIRTLRAFDAFPMTHHVECVAILEPGVPPAARGRQDGGGPVGETGGDR